MKITAEEMKRRRGEIISTAFHLFCQKGIDRVPLTEIAKRSGVGEATLYRYFINKPLLVRETLGELWGRIAVNLEQNMETCTGYSSMTGYEQVGIWMNACKQLYLANADYVLFSGEAKLYLRRNGVAISPELFDLLMMDMKDTCIGALDKGKADGTIPAKLDSLDMFYAIWGSLRGYIVKIVIYESLYSGKNPWESRYGVVKDGILCALCAGWDPLVPGRNQRRSGT